MPHDGATDGAFSPGDKIVTNRQYLHGHGWTGKVIGQATSTSYGEGWYDVDLEGAPVRVSYIHETEMRKSEPNTETGSE